MKGESLNGMQYTNRYFDIMVHCSTWLINNEWMSNDLVQIEGGLKTAFCLCCLCYRDVSWNEEYFLPMWRIRASLMPISVKTVRGNPRFPPNPKSYVWGKILNFKLQLLRCYHLTEVFRRPPQKNQSIPMIIFEKINQVSKLVLMRSNCLQLILYR